MFYAKEEEDEKPRIDISNICAKVDDNVEIALCGKKIKKRVVNCDVPRCKSNLVSPKNIMYVIYNNDYLWVRSLFSTSLQF